MGDDSVLIQPVEGAGNPSFTQLIGIIATITSIAQFFSGTFTAKKVWQAGTPGDLSPVPFIAGVLGSSLWFLYGVQLRDTTVMYTNVAGVTLNAFYVLVFYFFTHKRTIMSRQIFFMLTTITGVAVYIRSFEQIDAEVAKNHLGLICTVISLSCCASPLIALKHVIRTQSTEALPFPLIVSIFFVCLLWWIYGVLIGDFYMQLTNCLGTLISIIQLSLFFLYPSSHRPSREKGQELLS